MARKKRLEFGGINLRVHTRHKPEEYVAYWMALYQAQHTAVYGSNAMMIGEAKQEDPEDADSPITGYFYRFLNIDPSEPWFNIVRRKPATDTDVSALNIPEYLKPNLKSVPYVFLPKKHKLFFVSRATTDSIAPATVQRMLKVLSQRAEIAERFGKVDMTVLTDKREVEELLSWHVIKTLRIFIERPNATDYEDEADILERLEALGAGSETIVLQKAGDAQTITPDATIKKLAAVAADNGELEVRGRNTKDERDRASSKKFPMHESVMYDPSLQSPLQALASAVISRFL